MCGDEDGVGMESGRKGIIWGTIFATGNIGFGWFFFFLLNEVWEYEVNAKPNQQKTKSANAHFQWEKSLNLL